MAGFKMHISVSGVLGVGYAATGYLGLGMSWPTSALGGVLCGVSGMLPDVDSDSGIPLRETISFGAAVVPMLMIDRFQHMGLESEQMVLAGVLIYFLIRFGVASLLKRYTVHRGMWHSIPAAMITGLIGYMLCTCSDDAARIYKAGGMFAGYMSHLLLDEIYSIEWRRGVPRLKKSFGSATKFWGKSLWANLSTYGKLSALVVLAMGDPIGLSTEHVHEKNEIQHVEPAAETAALPIESSTR